MRSGRRGMSTSIHEALAKSVTFDAHNFWVEFVDGRQLGVPLAFFPRLAKATLAQRKKYLITGGGLGLHWDDLDEDISVPGLLKGRIDRTIQSTKKRKRVA